MHILYILVSIITLYHETVKHIAFVVRFTHLYDFRPLYEPLIRFCFSKYSANHNSAYLFITVTAVSYTNAKFTEAWNAKSVQSYDVVLVYQLLGPAANVDIVKDPITQTHQNRVTGICEGNSPVTGE